MTWYSKNSSIKVYGYLGLWTLLFSQKSSKRSKSILFWINFLDVCYNFDEIAVFWDILWIWLIIIISIVSFYALWLRPLLRTECLRLCCYSPYKRSIIFILPLQWRSHRFYPIPPPLIIILGINYEWPVHRRLSGR